jgi:DNA-binding transcriptional regulator YiaG
VTRRTPQDVAYVAPDDGGQSVTVYLPLQHHSQQRDVGEHSFGSVARAVIKLFAFAQQVFAGRLQEEQPMTPARFKLIREALGLSQADLAGVLRLGSHGKRTVARWEAGEVAVPGPVSVALEALESGWKPGDGKWGELRQQCLSVLDMIEGAVRDARSRVRATTAHSDPSGARVSGSVQGDDVGREPAERGRGTER